MTKTRRGRPRSAPAIETEFSKWFTDVLASAQLDPPTVAERLGTDLSTVYGWLAGKDPRLPMPLVRAGVLAVLRRPPAPPAQAMHPLPGKSSLTAPERAMEDATFRKTWRIVGRVWLAAKAAKFKPDHPATKRWKRIAFILDEYEHVGETPEPDTEKPWPAVGHPLHH